MTKAKFQPMAILGAGAFAREVFWHVYETYREEFEATPGLLEESFVFVDDFFTESMLDTGKGKYRVIKDWKFDRPYRFLVGVGGTKGKEAMVTKALAAGLKPHPTVIHPRALVQNAQVGVGGIITPGCVVTTQVKIGDYVVLNLNSTIGHDAIIEDFCTVNPGCSVSGYTHLHRGVTLGTGTVTREKSSIAAFVTTGAQSAVIKDITEAGIVVIGAPAKKLEK